MMTVRELISKLIEFSMDAEVDIEVCDKDNAIYFSTDKIEATQISDRFVVIYEIT